MTTLEYALDYLARGFSLVPLYAVQDGHCDCGKPACEDAGKHPRLAWRDLTQRHPSEKMVRAWFAQWPSMNIGIVTGPVSGVVVLDVDRGGEESLEDKPIPMTPMCRTGGGGRHVFFRYPPDAEIRNFAAKLPGLDLRAFGGYVVAAPSNHRSGNCYEWYDSMGLDDVDLAELPSWILELCAQKPSKPSTKPAGDKIGEGERNSTLFRDASAMRRRGLSESAIYAALKVTNAERCAPPLPDDELQKIAQSAAKYTPEGDFHDDPSQYKPIDAKPDRPTHDDHTEAGNAELFILQHGENLRYARHLGNWHVWSGKHWEPDADGAVTRLAIETTRSRYDELKLCDSKEERARLFGFIKTSENRGKLESMLAIAHDLEGVTIQSDMLDADPWALNVANGTVDLQTGCLKPHAQVDLITRCLPIEYDPDAECPRWLQFLSEVFAEDDDLIRFVARAVGYSLTGLTREQCFFLLHGMGSNGKSVFRTILQAITGEYARSTPMNTFLEQKNEGIRNDLAMLKVARIVCASETGQSRRFDEALLKTMTGQDPITARYMRQDFFTFVPQFKVWLFCNHLPRMDGGDYAMTRRIRLIPFTVRFAFPEDPEPLPPFADRGLETKLLNELPGILTWAIRGCLDWQRHSLGDAQAVKIAVRKYANDQDQFGQFLESCCVLTERASATAKDLFAEYCQWCSVNGERAASNNTFGRKLTDKGFTREHTRSGAIWHGLGLLVNREPGDMPGDELPLQPEGDCPHCNSGEFFWQPYANDGKGGWCCSFCKVIRR